MKQLFVFVFACTLLIGEARLYSDEFTHAPAPSIWIEAENFTTSNFDPGRVLANMTPTKEGASGGEFLSLNKLQHDDPTVHTYFAEYNFEVKVPGLYNLWIACSPQDSSWSSPLYYSLDGSAYSSMRGLQATSGLYGIDPQIYFGWVNPGVQNLAAGSHTLRLEVRDLRSTDASHVAFVDALFFTQDLGYRPVDVHPAMSVQPTWTDLVSKSGFDHIISGIQDAYYTKRLTAAHEYEGAVSQEEIVDKIMARTLPGPEIEEPGPHEFGLHGMETPFVNVGVDQNKIQKAYELLARVGVQGFRTAQSCWHRLGKDYNNYQQLDYQVTSGAKYGMFQLCTVGFAPQPFAVSTRGFSAVRPEYRDKFQDYIRTLLTRYKATHVIHYIEVGNEVDAPNPWWMDSTPAMYVEEVKLVKEAAAQVDPTIKVVAFAATEARNADYTKEDGGRQFVDKCFSLGIGDYCDAYSIHYTWPLTQADFPAFMRREEALYKVVPKPLLDSEEAAYGMPSDIIKEFARDFYLYKMAAVEHYLARDWYEAGTLLYSGLFDIHWNPKVRLLAYAAAVDGMKGRELVGMTEPAPGVEAYVLKKVGNASRIAAPYSVVIWQNDPRLREVIGTVPFPDVSISTPIPRVGEGVTGITWNLDPLKISPDGSFVLDEHPAILFMDKPPSWKLITPEEWLSTHVARVNDTQARLVPQQ